MSDDQKADDGAGMSQISPLQINIAVVLLAVVCFVGVVGNALVIFVYAQKNDKQTATLFILVLAVLDFITCLVMIPFTILLEASLWRLSVDFLCKAYFVLNSTNTIFGSLIISAIAVDRYLCICHPFSRLMTVPRARVMVIILVFIALVLGSPPWVGVRVVLESKENKSALYCIDAGFVNSNDTKAWQKLIMSIGHQTHSTTYLLCILSVTVLYVLIYLSVYRVRKKRQTLKGIRMKSLHASSRGRGGAEAGESGSGPRWWAVQRWRQRLTTKKPSAKQPRPGAVSDGADGHPKPQTAEIEICETAVDERQPLRPTTLDLHNEKPGDAAQSASLSYDKETGEASEMGPPPPYPGNGAAREAAPDDAKTAGPDEEPQEAMPGAQGGRRISMRFIKDTQVFQNFRTAAMLFIVAIVYILTFLPASLMSYKLVTLNLPVFYLYYLNNAANPIIYSFMNQHFREDIRQLVARLRNSATSQAGRRNHAGIRPKLTTTVSVFGNH